MTKREQARRVQQARTLVALGFTPEQAEALRRISMTLHRWHEKECGIGSGCITRDEEGTPHWQSFWTGRHARIADKERGALKRLAALVAARNGDSSLLGVSAYVQGDPRGAALYIICQGDVTEGQDVDVYYSRGVAVC